MPLHLHSYNLVTSVACQSALAMAVRAVCVLVAFDKCLQEKCGQLSVEFSTLSCFCKTVVEENMKTIENIELFKRLSTHL